MRANGTKAEGKDILKRPSGRRAKSIMVHGCEQVLSVVLCLIALIYLLARGEGFRHALGFIVVLLVASIPIAIEIVRCSSGFPSRCSSQCADPSARHLAPV